jgi:hypothetical protein
VLQHSICRLAMASLLKKAPLGLGIRKAAPAAPLLKAQRPVSVRVGPVGGKVDRGSERDGLLLGGVERLRELRLIVMMTPFRRAPWAAAMSCPSPSWPPCHSQRCSPPPCQLLQPPLASPPPRRSLASSPSPGPRLSLWA